MRWPMVTAGVVLLASTAVVVGAQDAPTPNSPLAARPRVVIDQTHNWTFAQGWLAGQILAPAGFDVFCSYASLDSKVKLHDTDVVYVDQYLGSSVAFAPEEIRRLKSYVETGGSLLMVINILPIQDLAAAFGITLKETKITLPLLTSPALQAQGAPTQIPLGAEEVRALVGPSESQPLVWGSNSETVALLLQVGEGRVICFSDYCRFWDFCAQPMEERQEKARTVTALFSLLSPPSSQRNGKGTVVSVPAEMNEVYGNVSLVYPATLRQDVPELLPWLPRVLDQVTVQCGGEPWSDCYRLYLLPGAGCGWSSGGDVGMGVEGTTWGRVSVLAHEWGHSYVGPLGVLSEPLANLVCRRVGLELAAEIGDTEAAKNLQQEVISAYTKLQGSSIGITSPSPGDDWLAAYRAMWLFDEFDRRYGPDYLRKFLRVCHALADRADPPPSVLYYYMGLAAGEDVEPYLRSLGITVEPCPPIPSELVQTKLAAYDRVCELRKANRDGDRLKYSDYIGRADTFRDDSWREAWSIKADDSWFRLDEIWADDIRWFRCAADRAVDPSSPNSTWRFGSTIRVFDESRKGVLLAAAPSVDHPFRMTRTTAVPRQGKTTMYVGAARRVGCKSALSVRVDGTVIWRRQMDTDLWIHVPIDLTMHAGKTVRLSLECDADGNASSREVLLDYVVVETEA